MNTLTVLSAPRAAVSAETTARAPAPVEHGPSTFGPREAAQLVALSEAVIAPGEHVEGGGYRSVDRLAAFLARMSDTQSRGVRALLWSIEGAAVAATGRPFSALDREARTTLLERWRTADSFATRAWLRACLTTLKAAHFDDESFFDRIGARYAAARPIADEKPRWLSQVTNGREVSSDLSLECEVVVVGTGAGGAAAAYELASRGRAVLLLEEGDLHRRADLDGRASRAFPKLYRDRGITIALGNAGIPVWAGRAVGGSTLVNSGTCYRTPERTFRYWRERHGMPLSFSSPGLDPYYRRVEAMLGVSAAQPAYLGGVSRVIARGAEALGYHHRPLSRNAPDCDGAGACCYGCPSGAKRSTDVSYVPAALARGAELITGARVDRVDVVAGRARGVTATLSSGRKLTVKAEAVVVAGGALMTPLLLARSGVGNTSGWLGKNLSIHPATSVLADMGDEVIDMSRGIPQSYAIESFADEGLMFEGSSTPPDLTALAIPYVGKRFTELVDRYAHLASFGLMVQDHGRGRVIAGPGGSPIIRYDLGERDLALIQRGLAVLADVFLRAGARRVLPFVHGHDEVSSPADVARLAAARIRPGDLSVAAFHPLGTCRAGADPRRSCVSPDLETHDTAGLFVCDGSVMPSSLGVNPQLTIMAMALRAAEGIDARLS
jgi:choline dehydrogenase-like flavoprotein